MSDDKYIAFDVHQATTVTSVLNAAGREVNTSIIATKAQPILSFVEGLRGKLHLTFEEGMYSAWLYDLLAGRVAELVVCDPRHNALLKEGNKTDAGDARKLAELLRAGMLRAVYHGSRSLRSLQELACSYEALVQDTTRVMNRIKAFYRSRGIDCAGRGVYTRKQRASWLERLPAGASRLRGELLHDQLDHLRSLRRKARRALLEESRKHTVAARLGEIPGLGPLRVALLIARVQTPHRFRSRRNFWTYVGLGLVRRGSAEYGLVGGRVVRRARAVNPRGLNPNHRPELKEIFKPAALTAIRRLGPFKDYYDPRAQQGVDPAILRVTVARKLAALTLSLWKKGGHYRAEGLKPQA
ncbi:MAG: transposase [Terriglobia bacterium]|jgi:transposase